MADYMKKPCKTCPFRTDVTPFLHPEVAERIAYMAANPYSSFSCHNTYSHDDEGEAVMHETTKECAGFLTLRAQDGEETPEGFEPSFDLCYSDPYEMIQAHEDEHNKN